MPLLATFLQANFVTLFELFFTKNIFFLPTKELRDCYCWKEYTDITCGEISVNGKFSILASVILCLFFSLAQFFIFVTTLGLLFLFVASNTCVLPLRLWKLIINSWVSVREVAGGGQNGAVEKLNYSRYSKRKWIFLRIYIIYIIFLVHKINCIT